ncbi:MAG TPA: hypothetical protein VN222_06245 [Novosphingobium sp.]|nr:hypothetical protein [Novosphingobium sp.]HZV08392.1 hypothetical protein [Novosphingobium sp.]
MSAPANDSDCPPARDILLQAALRHFARHGLGAADLAREYAEKAFFSGDGDSYRHWLSICRQLDRRMAEAIAAHRGSGRAAHRGSGRTRPRRPEHPSPSLPAGPE